MTEWETREIEKYGMFEITEDERKALWFTVATDVIQLPFSEYLNVKTNPSKSHYGYACIMAGDYVLDCIDIQFRRQIIVHHERYLVQLAWQESCNSKTIAFKLGAPLPDTPVDYPSWRATHIFFKLEPGVIIQASKQYKEMVKCISAVKEDPPPEPEPEDVPPPPEPPEDNSPPPTPENPQQPPPESAPPGKKIPLSLPYDGDRDNGNTYRRADPLPPPPEPLGPDCTRFYRVSWSILITYPQGQSETVTGTSDIQGEIRGFENFYNPAFGSWAFRVIRRPCNGSDEPQNIYQTTGATTFSGSQTGITPL